MYIYIPTYIHTDVEDIFKEREKQKQKTQIHQKKRINAVGDPIRTGPRPNDSAHTDRVPARSHSSSSTAKDTPTDPRDPEDLIGG